MIEYEDLFEPPICEKCGEYIYYDDYSDYIEMNNKYYHVPCFVEIQADEIERKEAI